jgi:osmotically inducible protein OsmC
MATKRASVTWMGGLEDGTGQIREVGSGAVGSLGVSWAARTGDEQGTTSPEELIAAAHASCMSMALSNVLGKAGTPPVELSVSAAVTFVPGTGITSSELEVTGRVPGISEKQFVKAAETAKDNCPVSKALSDDVEVGVTARLAA